MAKKAKQDSQACPRCGASVKPDALVCPNGHPFVSPNGETADAASDPGLMESPGTSRTKMALPNTIFECYRCERLVETQYFHERTVVPRFCPWCGKPVSPIVGREIDGYRVDSVIARGGFGIVYLASNIAQSKMKAVIKFLRPEMVYRRPELVRIFVEEARLTEEIGSKCWNVVRVSNVREKPWPYFFMEYLRGATLEEVIEEAAETKPIPLEDCKGYLRGIAKALVATHAHGRVHRDLKPLNIMVIKSQEISRPEERIKLLDFGLAMKIAGAKVGQRRSTVDVGGVSELSDFLDQVDSPVQSAGTPEYMPPEAFDGINEFGGDVYSFGIAAYEVLTATRPWKDPSVDTDRFFYWREAHKKKPPRSVREIRSDVPAWLSKVVTQCLEKKPKDRIPSSEALLERLKDPLPTWVWAASAAAALLVAVLVLLAAWPGDRLRVNKWDWEVKERGKQLRLEGPWSPDQPLKLWVRDTDHLSQIAISVSVGTNRRFSAIEADPSEHVNLRNEGESFQIDFGPSSALLGRSIRLVGSGPGFDFEGAIHIQDDVDPPELDTLTIVTFGPLQQKQRLQSEEKLQIKIREENPQTTILELSPLDSDWNRISGTAPVEIRGERSGSGVQSVWKFALASLNREHYQACVVARDKAGNERRSEPIDFQIDNNVAFHVPEIYQNHQTFLVGGTAFYEFSIGEAIAKIECDDCRIYERPPSVQSSLELAPKVGDLKSVALRELREQQRYLLAFRVPREVKECKFQVKVTDTAKRSNDTDVELKCDLPGAMTKGDIAAISVLPEGEEELQASRKEPALAFTLSRPIQHTRIKRLRVKLRSPTVVQAAPKEIHEAQCQVQGKSWPASSINPGDVVFEGLELAANTSNSLVLTFRDSLGNEVSLGVEVKTDDATPTLKATPVYKNGHNVVTSWGEGDVELHLESNEPLEKVQASLETPQGDREFKLAGRSKGPPNQQWIFDLKELASAALPVEEGEYPLRGITEDTAGNSESFTAVLHVNTSPPKIEPELVGLIIPGKVNTLVLDKGEVRFALEDGNDVDYAKAKADLAYWKGPLGDGDGTRAKVQTEKKGRALVVTFKDLPSECTGIIRVAVPDSLGLAQAQPKRWKFGLRFWQPRVEWRGVTWVRVDAGSELFYISRCEISNLVYRLQKGHAGVLPSPAYWGIDDKFPEYWKGGERKNGDHFPVVGLSPEEAETFAKKAFQARLPTWDEWREAAWKENRGGRYPWLAEGKGEDVASRYCNVYRRDDSGTPFVTRQGYMVAQGKHVESWAVEVNFDPWSKCPENIKRNLNYRGELLHLIGNVSELVWLSDKRRRCVEAGGYFHTNYDKISLTNPEGYPLTRNRYDGPGPQAGFRVLIEPRNAHPDFIKIARAVDQR